MGAWRGLVLVLLAHARAIPMDPVDESTLDKDARGRIQMGVSNSQCDDGVRGVEIDWDGSIEEYVCPTTETLVVPGNPTPNEECLTPEQLTEEQYLLMHRCLYQAINYTDIPPRAGNHRPLWPRYGEYLYVPPQRWVHSLEHAAAVFLYHPCADKNETRLLRAIARKCLFRHIITPYRHLPPDRPFAIVSYGCRLMMAHVHAQPAMNFIKKHAILDGPEKVSRDGQFDIGLMREARVVSDQDDTTVCPIMAQNDLILSESELSDLIAEESSLDFEMRTPYEGQSPYYPEHRTGSDVT